MNLLQLLWQSLTFKTIYSKHVWMRWYYTFFLNPLNLPIRLASRIEDSDGKTGLFHTLGLPKTIAMHTLFHVIFYPGVTSEISSFMIWSGHGITSSITSSIGGVCHKRPTALGRHLAPPKRRVFPQATLAAMGKLLTLPDIVWRLHCLRAPKAWPSTDFV